MAVTGVYGYRACMPKLSMHGSSLPLPLQMSMSVPVEQTTATRILTLSGALHALVTMDSVGVEQPVQVDLSAYVMFRSQESPVWGSNIIIVQWTRGLSILQYYN